MTSRSTRARADRLLTPAEAADYLSTSERFIRRLIAERRIGSSRSAATSASPNPALREFIEAGPNPTNDGRRKCHGTREESRNGEQGRAPTFRQHPQAAVGPVPDPLSGTGRPVADRRRHLPSKMRPTGHCH